MSFKAIDKLDERRKVLLAANPYIAENAKLPPEATVNGEELYGRLGRDLRATAAALVDAIDAELKEESIQKDAENVGEPKNPDADDQEPAGTDVSSADADKGIDAEIRSEKPVDAAVAETSKESEPEGDDDSAEEEAESDDAETGVESVEGDESEEESESDENKEV